MSLKISISVVLFFCLFILQDVFEAACDYAREYGGLLWEDSKRMRLVVKAEIFAHMKEFLRSQKQ